jgi:hypothetical protein
MPGGGCDRPTLSSRPVEFHPQALPKPCMNLAIHTDPDVRPLHDRFANEQRTQAWSSVAGKTNPKPEGPWVLVGHVSPRLNGIGEHARPVTNPHCYRRNRRCRLRFQFHHSGEPQAWPLD